MRANKIATERSINEHDVTLAVRPVRKPRKRINIMKVVGVILAAEALVIVAIRLATSSSIWGS